MLMKISHQHLTIKAINWRVRQKTAGVLGLVILLHVSVLYFISLEKIKLHNTARQQAIEVKILPQPKPVIIKPAELPKITQKAEENKPKQPVEKLAKPKVDKAVAQPSPSIKAQAEPEQDIPQPPVVATTRQHNTAQTVTTTTTTTVSSDSTPNTESNQKTSNAVPSTAGSSNKAASTDSRSGCAEPVYPDESATNGDEGTTTLALMIGEDGKVLDAKIDRSSGFADLDRAAKKALVLCTFHPATRNGQPQQSWAKLSWKWQLKD